MTLDEVEWSKESSEWVIASPGHRCEHQSGFGLKATRCGRPAVAGLKRSRKTKRVWYYCEQHLYGRRIKNSRVEGLRIIKRIP